MIPRRLNRLCRRFGTLCPLSIKCLNDLQRWNKVFRNGGAQNLDGGESRERKNTTFRTRRKFETKYNVIAYIYNFMPTVTISFLQAGSSICAWFSFFCYSCCLTIYTLPHYVTSVHLPRFKMLGKI